MTLRFTLRAAQDIAEIADCIREHNSRAGLRIPVQFYGWHRKYPQYGRGDASTVTSVPAAGEKTTTTTGLSTMRWGIR